MFGTAHMLFIAHSALVRAAKLDPYLIEEMLIDLHLLGFWGVGKEVFSYNTVTNRRDFHRDIYVLRLYVCICNTTVMHSFFIPH